MKSDREKQLVDLLNDYDVTGIKFPQAKKELIALGYTESEIVYGLYSAPFDGVVNEPRPPNPLQKLYENSPEQASKIARTLLQDLADKEHTKTAAYAAASNFGDQHNQSYYSVRTADRLGIPYFAPFFLVTLFMILATKFHVSEQTTNTIVIVFSSILTAIFIYRFLQERSWAKRAHAQPEKINQ